MSAATDVLGTVLSSGTPWGKILGLVGGVGTGILNYFQTKRQNAHLAAALVLAIAVFGGGCPRKRPVAAPAAPVGAGQQVSNAQAAANNAQTAATTADAGRLTKVRANIDAAATAPNIDAAPVAQNELIVAQGRLSDVKPDPAEAAEAANRRALVESGRAAEARKNAEAAAEQGKRDAAEIVALRAEAKRLAAERDQLASDLIAQAERNRIENQKAIDAAVADAKKARDEQHNSMLKSQAEKLTRIGIGCLSAAVSIAVLVGFFGSLLVLRKTGVYLAVLALVGFLFLGAAQIIASPYFMPACVAVILGGCVWFGIWAWRHQKRGDLAQEMQARTAKVAAVATTVVPILDSAYEQAEGPVKEWLDTHLLGKLSSAMDRATKATVHEIRATSATPDVSRNT